MNTPPADWPDNLPRENSKENNDDSIRVSKSQIKRDAEALKDLGVALIGLGKNALNRIPLDEDLRIAIELAQKIKKEGYRRQVQLIGKMLRARDIEPIQTALDKMKNSHQQDVLLFHRLEMLRDRLIAEGDAAIDAVLVIYPHADRQQLRTLVRHVQKEQGTSTHSSAWRQLWQYLRQLT